MKAASRMGATTDAAACRKITATATAAVTITARERGEKLLKSFILIPAIIQERFRHTRAGGYPDRFYWIPAKSMRE
jgi:hypothetical protein